MPPRCETVRCAAGSCQPRCGPTPSRTRRPTHSLTPAYTFDTLEARSLRHDPYADAPRLPDAELIDPRLLLDSTDPVELEVGPGKGGFILERLESDPAARIVGLEIRRKWATLVDRRIAQRGWGGRGRVFAADVKLALGRFPAGCLSRIYVHFPDPWWKARHEKRLVVNREFIEQAARVLQPGGDVFLQTDVPERAEVYEQLFAEHPAFGPWGQSARVDDPDFGARSTRERRALQDGLPIHRLRFRLIS